MRKRNIIVGLIAIIIMVSIVGMPALGFGGITSQNRNPDCNSSGCHSPTTAPTMTMSASATQVAPGQQITVTVSVSGTNPTSGREGVILLSSFSPTSGQPSADGWTIVSGPSGSGSVNLYVVSTTSSSGSFTWTLDAPTAPGVHTLYSRVGYVGSNGPVYADYTQGLPVTVTETPTPTAPTVVNITSPAPGAVVSGNVAVNVTVNDPTNVSYAVLMVDNSTVANITTAPFTFQLDTVNLTNGAHTLNVSVGYINGTVTSSQQVITVSNVGTTGQVAAPSIGMTILAGVLAVIAILAVLLVATLALMKRNRGGK